MGQIKMGSAGVTAGEKDISGPLTQQPVGIPACVIGTSQRGAAFVPKTVGLVSDWKAKFGNIDETRFGPLAVNEWLRNAQSLTYLKVLGVGDGRARSTSTGKVTSAGFVVGEQQPSSSGVLTNNPYANSGGELGKTYFLGCFMSESAGSFIFSEANLQGSAAPVNNVSASVPIVRGVLMAPSGVVLRLSSAAGGTPPTSTTVGGIGTSAGHTLGSVVLSENGIAKQEFVLFLNGHKGTDPKYPNVLTASFDPRSSNHMSKVLNTDPYKLQEAGHYLYASFDIHSSLAVVTGTGVVLDSVGANAAGAISTGKEHVAFILSSSTGHDAGSASVPNYESFQDRFGHAQSPWVISQKFGGTPVNLFKLHGLDDGTGTAIKFKVTVSNLTVSNDPLNKYGSFDVSLREWSDRDTNVKPLAKETYNGVNLDPSSDRYIAKVIGDMNSFFDFDREESEQKLVVEGEFENRSNLVRVEMSSDVSNGFVSPEALPMGFRGVDHLVTSGSSIFPSLSVAGTTPLNSASYTVMTRVVTPPLPFRRKITTSTEWSTKEQVDSKFTWGIQFEHPLTLDKKNESIIANKTLEAFSKFYPQFSLSEANFATGSNPGQADTTALGVLDADRFCNNIFTLENIQVVTGSNGLADVEKWNKAIYCRNGAAGSVETSRLGTDASKIRAFKIEDLASPVSRRFAKFTFMMQGGFDGVNIFNEDETLLTNAAVAADMVASNARSDKPEDGPNVRAYVKAIEVAKNTTEVDATILAVPGIRVPIITDSLVAAAEERFDAMAVIDIEQLDEDSESVESDSDLVSVINTVDTVKNRALDSSFGAAYFPDMLYTAPNKVNTYAPPSVVVLGAIAYNDKVAHPWDAPAGFARGALPEQAQEPRVKLSKTDMDLLYDANINPIVAFPGVPKSGLNPKGGVVIWGQRTLQVAASALDRVNVRRLLIAIRREVKQIAESFLFEPNLDATLAKFSAAVNPVLQRVQAQSGVEKFKVLIDTSTTTQEDVLNNTLRGKVILQPTKTIEFVSLDFVVTNNLAQLD